MQLSILNRIHNLDQTETNDNHNRGLKLETLPNKQLTQS